MAQDVMMYMEGFTWVYFYFYELYIHRYIIWYITKTDRLSATDKSFFHSADLKMEYFKPRAVTS